jgi:hypothetical protein
MEVLFPWVLLWSSLETSIIISFSESITDSCIKIEPLLQIFLCPVRNTFLLECSKYFLVKSNEWQRFQLNIISGQISVY